MNVTKSLRKPFLITVATLAVACGANSNPPEPPHANPPAPSDTAAAAVSAAVTAAPAVK